MLLAQLDTTPRFQPSFAPLFEDHGLPLAVMGILVVFLALVLVATFIALLPRVLAIFTPRPVVPPKKKPAGDAKPEEELPEDVLVVIAAAVAATMDAPHRIVNVTGVDSENYGWSMEGRLQQHYSHKMGNRNRR